MREKKESLQTGESNSYQRGKNSDTISRQQKFEGQEKDERSSKNVKRELVLADDIAKHSSGVPGSSLLIVMRSLSLK